MDLLHLGIPALLSCIWKGSLQGDFCRNALFQGMATGTAQWLSIAIAIALDGPLDGSDLAPCH